jgi:two-component system phosphate regulon response regulator OmpR
MTSQILMVEGDEALAEMVSQYLAQSGYELRTTTTGKSVVPVLADTAFDAVTLDIMLPDIDGFEVCRRIRASSDVPILMLTSRGDELDRIVGLELGHTITCLNHLTLANCSPGSAR